ncbi:Dihydropteroate synthase [Chitinispirillum alkaliphilum]|nr:Dihydropteroate synthase [Chitinispirillum alkaliphilum]
MTLQDRKPFALMGIVNVTPDSFYDGGQYNSIENAVAHGLKLRDEGADILDIGGASSRPGAPVVDPQEEIRRVIPVIKRLASEFNGPLSVDTTWAVTAKAALQCGATWVNDISAGRFDPQMPTLVAQSDCSVVLMHSRETPQTMQHDPRYQNVTEDVKNELKQSVKRFTDAGVSRDRIILDPGIGFAKSFEHNILLMQQLERLKELGFPLLIGTSRKSFIGKITNNVVSDRLFGSLATVATAFLRGVTIFRVHDVKETRDFLNVFSRLESEEPFDNPAENS